MIDIKSQLEAALKAHLSSLPEGGDVPPPAVDPSNVTGVNDDKPELHIATPEGPKVVSQPMDRAQFQSLSRSQRAKVIDSGMAPPGVSPRTYQSPSNINAAINQHMRNDAPKMDMAKVDELDAMPDRSQASPPPASDVVAPRQAVKPAAGGPSSAPQVASGEQSAAMDQGGRLRRLSAVGEAFDEAAHKPMHLADFAISQAGGHPVETGPDRAGWANLRAEADRPMKELASRLALQRQQTEDQYGHRLKESEISKNSADAYKALHPESKAPAAADVAGIETTFGPELKASGVTHEQLAAMDKEGLQNQFAEFKSQRDRANAVAAAKEQQATGSALALRNAKLEAEFRNGLPGNTPEALVEQYQGAIKGGSILDAFEKSGAKVEGMGKVTGKLPLAASGALGDEAANASTYEADRERTAIALARGLEGGMARPGNVEIIMKILPHATDSAEVKAKKIQATRDFMAAQTDSIRKTVEAGNYKLKLPPAEAAQPQGGHGKVVKETKSVRQYEDGFFEAK